MMGFFDWFGGKKRKERPEEGLVEDAQAKRRDERQAKPRAKARAKQRPVCVTGLEESSMFVSVGLKDGTLQVMDRDTYDYMYGEASGPDPAQSDIAALLPRITRVRALSGGLVRGKAVPSAVLLDTSEPAALDALRGCFAISEDPGTFRHCACLGGPTLELFAGAEPAVVIGLQHGHAIRWGQWKHDATLLEGHRLTAWLIQNGVQKRLLEMLFKNPFPFTGGRIDGVGSDPFSPAKQRIFLAEILAGRGDLDGALAECDAVVAADPALGEAYELRAQVRSRKGQAELSLADYSRAIERGQRSAGTLFKRALELDRLGRHEEAIDDCTSAIAIDPKHANAYNSRGVIRMTVGRLNEARSDLDTANRLAPDWEMPYLNRAQLAILRSDWRAAVNDYAVAIDKVRAKETAASAPMLAMLYWNRGRAYESLGDRARAEADQREALKRDPTLADATGKRVYYS